MNPRFRYNNSTISKSINVILDGSKVGEIKPVISGGFAYFPNGSKTGGETFDTVKKVKNSIEAP